MQSLGRQFDLQSLINEAIEHFEKTKEIIYYRESGCLLSHNPLVTLYAMKAEYEEQEELEPQSIF